MESTEPDSLLLVDDERHVSQGLRRILYRDQYRIHVASTAVEAMAVLGRTRVDVIVSDQRMPNQKGTDFLSAVRDLYPNTVRMILSGAAELDDVVRAMESGAIHKFLTKPIDPALFRANVREAFARAASLASRGFSTEQQAGLATGLAGKSAVERAFMDLVARSHSKQHKVWLLMLKIDQYDNVVRSFGLSFGWSFLRAVADELARVSGKSHILGQDGPGVFLLLGTAEDPIARIACVDQEIERLFAHPLTVANHSIAVTISIGATTVESELSFDQAVDQAFTAMSTGSERGGDTMQIYQPHLVNASRGRLELEAEFRQALAAKSFQLYYQPQVDVRSGRIVGLEALLRWHHPSREFVSPTEFIPLAERLGLITELGEWVLETAVTQVEKWHESGTMLPELAINVSAFQLTNLSLVDSVRSALRRHRLPPHQLVIEVTESAAIEQQSAILECLHALHELGVTLAIDDFGTGYSNIGNLARFDFTKLKIDRSLLQQIREERGRKLYANIVGMAQELGLVPIAEGVEKSTELEAVRIAGCSIVQGYFYSEPLGVAKIERLLGTRLPKAALGETPGPRRH